MVVFEAEGGPGPALPKLALDHSSPPQDGRPWTTLGGIGPTLDRVVQGWTNAEIAALGSRYAQPRLKVPQANHRERNFTLGKLGRYSSYWEVLRIGITADLRNRGHRMDLSLIHISEPTRPY